MFISLKSAKQFDVSLVALLATDRHDIVLSEKDILYYNNAVDHDFLIPRYHEYLNVYDFSFELNEKIDTLHDRVYVIINPSEYCNIAIRVNYQFIKEVPIHASNRVIVVHKKANVWNFDSNPKSFKLESLLNRNMYSPPKNIPKYGIVDK